MDSVKLKAGWLEGRSGANVFGPNPCGDAYEVSSGFGFRDGGLRSNITNVTRHGRPPPVSMGLRSDISSRNSSHLRSSATSSTNSGVQLRGSQAVVFAPPSASNVVPVSYGPSWGQSRPPTHAPHAVQPGLGKSAPPSGSYGKTPTPIVRAPAPSSQGKATVPSQSRSSSINSVGSKPPTASHPHGEKDKDKVEESKQSRKEKLEERRRFLEELSRQPSGAGSNVDDNNPPPTPEEQEARIACEVDVSIGSKAIKGMVAPSSKPIIAPAKQAVRAVSKEEWDAKWREMYGSFVAVALRNGDGVGDAEEEALGDAEGESLLTAEELASFKAEHGNGVLNGQQRRRRKQQLLLLAASSSFALASAYSGHARTQAQELSSEDDSDDDYRP